MNITGKHSHTQHVHPHWGNPRLRWHGVLTLLLAATATLAVGEARADFAYAWGDNQYGEVGDGSPANHRSAPVAVSGLSSGVTAVAAGSFHSLAIQNGGAYAWGYNQSGQLGVALSSDTYPQSYTPAPVIGLASGVTAVAGGDSHSVAVQNGSVWAWGYNGAGQLGDGTMTERLTPEQIASAVLYNVSAIAAGSFHNLALQNGGVWAWGANGSGNLGDGTTTLRTTPVAVIGLTSGVTAISAGFADSLAVQNGSAFAWGYNNLGQLGDGSTTNSSVPIPVVGLSKGVTAIAAGLWHGLAVKDGGVWAWGDNSQGELGDGTTHAHYLPEQIDSRDLHNIIDVAAGANSSYALSSDGSLWVWGYNIGGQMGLGNENETFDYLTPQHLLPPSGYIFTSIGASSRGTHAVARLLNVSGPGDYNHDGVVDAADYLVWRKTDGRSPGYDVWRAHFGQPFGSGAGASANAAVPEPTTFVLAALGFTSLAAWGWRCRNAGRALNSDRFEIRNYAVDQSFSANRFSKRKQCMRSSKLDLLKFIVSGVILAVLPGNTRPAAAVTYTWNHFAGSPAGVSGSFSNSSNWSPTGGPPEQLDTALIVVSEADISFDSDWSVAVLNSYGRIDFGMNGHTLTTSGMNTGYCLNNATLYNGDLRLTDGTLRLNGNANLSAGSGATGDMIIDDAAFTATDYVYLATDSNSSYYLTVRHGGSFLAGGTSGSYVGANSSAAAFVTVDGNSSSFSLGANSYIGIVGSGQVNVQNGGAMHTTGGLVLASSANSSGTVTLTDAGSSWTHTDGYIATGAGNTAGISVNTGTTMTVAGTSAAAGITLGSHATLAAAGTVNVSGVGASGITVNSGGTLEVDTLGTITTQNLTRTGTGILRVFGGTLAVSGGTFNNGGAGLNYGSGTFQLQNAATSSNVTDVSVGAASVIPAVLKILSGSTFAATGQVAIGGTNGSVLIDGAGSTMSSDTSNNSTRLLVGGTVYSGDAGSLTVQNGGRYYYNDLTASAVIGSSLSSTGTVTVTGGGSRFNVGGLHVGSSGNGILNVTSGGAVTGATTTIAEGSGSISSTTVSGAGSRLDVSDLRVGIAGNATLNIAAGGAVTSARATIGELSNGFATVSGAGSSWTATNGLYIGGTSTAAGGGTSLLTLANGGAVNVIGETKLWNSVSLYINGGTLTTGSFTDSGALNIQNGTLIVDGSAGTGVFTNGNGPTNLAIQGNAINTLSTLQLINGASTANVAALSVGDSHPGALVLSGGSQMTASSVAMATQSGGTSSITISGPNTALFSGPITCGSQSTLTIGASSAVSAGALYAAGTINLNGGTLGMASFSPIGGAFNWSGGTVNYSASTIVDSTQLTALLGTSGTLIAGHTLGSTSGTMTLTANLTVAGGQLNPTGLANSAALTVASGCVSAGTLTNAGLIVVSGGSITATAISNNGEIQLASPSATIGASGATLTNAGRLDGNGRVNSNLSNSVGGVVAVDAGQRLVFGGSTNVNNSNGTISLTGGTVEFTAPLTNATGGFISGRGAFRGNSANNTVGAGGQVDYGLKNSGVVAFSGGFSDVFGKVNNLNGGAIGGSGQIINAGGGIVTFHDDVINNGAEIRTVAGSRSVFFGAVSGAGPFTGTGTVEFDGDLRPGNSPATVAFGGDLELGYSAKLQIEIGGTTPGFQYDQVHVAGHTLLDGTLQVLLTGGFIPSAGQIFDVLDWGSLNGAFEAVQLPTLPAGQNWDTSQLYASGQLAVVGAGLIGDYNLNHTVDAADYIVWRKGLGTNYTQSDYGTWRAHFGQASGSGAGITASAAIPEPATLMQMILMATVVFTTWRRNAQRVSKLVDA